MTLFDPLVRTLSKTKTIGDGVKHLTHCADKVVQSSKSRQAGVGIREVIQINSTHGFAYTFPEFRPRLGNPGPSTGLLILAPAFAICLLPVFLLLLPPATSSMKRCFA